MFYFHEILMTKLILKLYIIHTSKRCGKSLFPHTQMHCGCNSNSQGIPFFCFHVFFFFFSLLFLTSLFFFIYLFFPKNFFVDYTFKYLAS
jgi:hypothetical protein